MNTSTLRGTTNTTEVDTNTQGGNSKTNEKDSTSTSTATVPDTGFFTGENGSSAATMVTVLATAIFFAAVFVFFRNRFHSGPARRYVRRSR